MFSPDRTLISASAAPHCRYHSNNGWLLQYNFVMPMGQSSANLFTKKTLNSSVFFISFIVSVYSNRLLLLPVCTLTKRGASKMSRLFCIYFPICLFSCNPHGPWVIIRGDLIISASVVGLAHRTNSKIG